MADPIVCTGCGITHSLAEPTNLDAPRSLAAPSLLAHIIILKYGQGMPLFGPPPISWTPPLSRMSVEKVSNGREEAETETPRAHGGVQGRR